MYELGFGIYLVRLQIQIIYSLIKLLNMTIRSVFIILNLRFICNLNIEIWDLISFCF
jgi:hypothetical protein